MSYSYAEFRHYVFTEEGQATFLKIRDHAHELIKASGAAMLGAIIENCTGLNWHHIACVDRLVELGELREVNYGDCAGQHRIFVSRRSS